MMINDVHQGIRKNKPRKRIGRGPGSGTGKTSTRGHKGWYSRSGTTNRLGYTGGQTPLARRIAKRGFNNRQFAPTVLIVNVSVLNEAFESGATVNPQTLLEKGLAKGAFDEIKILGNGDLTKKLTVEAHRFSKSAEEKITKQGGSVKRLGVPG
ncbi:MAG TPA: 50S ribosomal protein L15 [Planctomycetaceae bacterium]|nr:50S ribosomal protein L15 [Planctomycetaceae bacterium]